MLVISQVAIPQIDTVTVALVVAIITLIGTLVVTILNATWLETRRQLIKRKIEKNALHDALYSEIAWTVSALADMITNPTRVSLWSTFLDRASSLMNLDAYNYTRREPTLFYQLDDAHRIELFYQWMIFTQRDIEEAANLWARGPRLYNSEEEGVTEYKIDFLKSHLAHAVKELDINELKRGLFIPHGVKKDPREFVDELVILMQQDATEEHMQESVAPMEPEKEEPEGFWARLRGR
jgi:hypothetical protein